MAYLVECRTSSLDESLRAPRLVMQVLDSLKRSQVLRDPDVVLDPDTRSLTMTARIETARTPQLAAVMASNELLWRTNQYCGDDPARHVKITHLVVAAGGLLVTRASRENARRAARRPRHHLRRRRRDALAPGQDRRARRLPEPRRAGRGRDRRELPLGRAAPAPHRRRLGRAARSARRPPDAPGLEVAEVDAAFAAIEAASGAGSAAVRRAALAELFARATADEQRFLALLAGGELRQGALAGIVTDAVAAAAGVDAAAVRRAAMLAGDLPAVAEAALTSGAAGLEGFHLQVGRPVQPMLAKTAPSLEAALAGAGPSAVEWKLDGVRIQVHRDGDDVAIFTRTLDPVGERMPEIAEAVRALPLRSVILDGEAIALRPDGRPRPFQETASRAASRGDVAGPARGGAADGVLLRRPAPRRPRPPRPARERAAGRDRAAPAGGRVGAAARHGRIPARRRRSSTTPSRAATRASS